MDNLFENRFSELQADMVSICLEYVEERADKIYIYSSYEEGFLANNFFYDINGIIIEKHKLNDALVNQQVETDFSYDVSYERQEAVYDILNENVKQIIKLCKEYDKDMPTEMKLTYDVESGHFKAEYKYELVYTHDEVKTANAIAKEWLEEIRSNK